MKNILFITVSFLLISISAQADANFYQCTLPQAEEYRVGIDVQKDIAGFFDNDSTSIMKYKGFRKSKANPNNNVLIYEGKDLGGDGGLKLEFNIATKRIKLSTVENDGTIELLGYANCNIDTPWSWDDADLEAQ